MAPESRRTRPHVVLAADPVDLVSSLFPGDVRRRLDAVADVWDGVVTDWGSAPARAALATADVVIAGWGAPRLGEAELAAAPRLHAVLHGGGSAYAVVDERLATERGLLLSDAGTANAEPVAEFTLAAILMAGKDAFRAERLYRERQTFVDRQLELGDAGNYARTVGVVGASRTGRRVIEMLRPFAFDVLVSDPTISAEQAHELGAELVDLDELVRRSEILTLHVPVTESTISLVGAAEIAAMPQGATLINTSRGVVVDQDALVEAVAAGRLQAVLDVTEPDPLPAGHPLYSLPGVFLTPHVAGAVGREIARLGDLVVDEVERLVAGQPLRHAPVPERAVPGRTAATTGPTL